MTSALFKRSTATAQQASLRLVRDAPVPVASNAIAEPAKPSPESIEIDSLRREVSALTEELNAVRQDWDQRLKEASQDAQARAAREHASNDAAILETIEQCLSRAQSEFRESLTKQIEPLAAGLAAAVTGKLVELRQDEADWLGRVIRRRLESVASGSLVAIQTGADTDSDVVARTLADYVGRGVELQCDANLPAGTARIVLKLGDISVAPQAALQRLLQTMVLEDADAG